MSASAGWQDYVPKQAGADGWQDATAAAPNANLPGAAKPHVNVEYGPEGTEASNPELNHGYTGPGAWSGHQMDRSTEKKYMGTVGAGATLAAGVMGGKVAAPVVGAIAAKHPLLTATVASEGIRAARNIPVVGKMIPPYSEMLPYLVGGRGERKMPPVEAEEIGPTLSARPQPKLSAPARPTPAPSVRSVPQAEWDAGQELNTPGIENTPKLAPPTGYANSSKPELLSRMAGHVANIKATEAANPPPDEDLTPQLEESLKRVKQRKMQ